MLFPQIDRDHNGVSEDHDRNRWDKDTGERHG
jgi:hypothetical protein